MKLFLFLQKLKSYSGLNVITFYFEYSRIAKKKKKKLIFKKKKKKIKNKKKKKKKKKKLNFKGK